MSAGDVETLERVPMSLEEFLALPEGVRAEWVDGVAIMSPQPTRGHNKVSFRLARLLEDSLPGLDVAFEVGVSRPDRRRYRVPDIAVFEEFEDLHWTDSLPVLVVEVLSPSTRSEDMLRKSDEYRIRGIGQYWVVDRDNFSFTVLGNDGDRWNTLLEADRGHPTGEVVVGEHGVVAVDLEQLLSF